MFCHLGKHGHYLPFCRTLQKKSYKYAFTRVVSFYRICTCISNSYRMNSKKTLFLLKFMEWNSSEVVVKNDLIINLPQPLKAIRTNLKRKANELNEMRIYCMCMYEKWNLIYRLNWTDFRLKTFVLHSLIIIFYAYAAL